MSDSYKPTETMRSVARRALEWRKKYKRGGTAVGVARARDIANGKSLSASTVKRMYSFFSRHSNNKAEHYAKKMPDGGPSPFRIAWDLWGGSTAFNWSKGKVAAMERGERQCHMAESVRAITDAVEKGLRKKVADHNEKYGDDPAKRATYSMMAACFRRGIGAYKTNPQSVRPNVKSPEQWAYARCNSLLYCLRNGKFRSGKHDTDLLPSEHPLSTKGK